MWLPSEVVDVGAVGCIRDGVFQQQTDLRQIGVSFKTTNQATRADFDYQSSSGVSGYFKLAGDESDLFTAVGKASAGVVFKFSRAGAVVFSAPACRVRSMQHERSVASALRRLSDWDRDWFVVSKVALASSATILVSGSSNSSVELRARGTLGPDGVEILDLASNFSLASHKDMAVKIVASGKLSPLYVARQLRNGQLV
jgi:hypothetical protein